jgi:CHAD domain-containing protein
MDELIALRVSSARSSSAGQRLLRTVAKGKPRRLRLAKTMPADEAFRAILADCLGAISAQAGVLRGGRSVEGLHHLRVALRRLEVMLAAFGKAFGQDWFAELRGRAKAISARLGPARDMDVFLEDLWPQAIRAFDGRGGGGDFAALRRAAEDMQATAWEAVADCIASEDFSHLLDDIAALSQSSLPLGDGRKVKPVSRDLLKTAARRVARRGRAARSQGEADLHRLRIALKKLRYLTQAFACLYPQKRVKPALKAIRQMQEELGHLNDIAHVRSTIAELVRNGDAAAIGHGAGWVAGHYDAGRDRAAKKALKRYRDFRTLKPFWKKTG